MFADIGIRKKLAFGFGVLMALAVAVAAGGLIGLRTVHDSFQSAIERGLQVERLASEMKTELLEARSAEQMFLMRVKSEGFEAAREKWVQANRQHLTRLLAAMAQLEVAKGRDGSAPSVIRITDDLVSLTPYLRVYAEDFEATVELIRRAAPQSEIDLKMASLGSSVVVVEPLVADIARQGQQHAAAAIAAAHAASRRTALIVGASLGVALLSGLLFAYRLGEQIAKPLRGLASTAEAIGAGDLTARAEVATGDEIGALGRTLNAMTDKLKQTLEGLRQSEEKYRSIYENSLEGIYQVSMDGRALGANPAMARMLGFDSPAELVASLTDIAHQLYAHPEERELMLATLLQTGMLRRELEFFRKDKQPIWVSINARVVRDKAGAPQLIEGFVSDITEQRRAAAERQAREVAEAANRAKSDFLARMSHELRTPLNAVLGYAQILKRGPGVGDRQAAGLDTIQRSGEHLLTLIDDILDLARIEAGKLDLYPAPLEMAPFVRDIVDLMRVRAEAKGLAFVCAAADLPLIGSVDEKRLRQVLLNLLGNAVKFTDAGRVALRVRTQAQGASDALVRFEVEDTGVGMTSEQLSQLFQPFQQVGDVRSRRGGTGLGLAISRELVRLMGGDIDVRSQPERGSTFSFDLRVPVVKASAWMQAPQRTAIGYEGRPQRLLVVDDVPVNRALLIDMLGPLGFEMFEAEDGLQGVERAQLLRPDAILMDNVMPVMDGFEATCRLRALPALAQVPIISISASAAQADKERALASGASAFLPKPVRTADLLALLERHLGIRFIYEQQGIGR